jgi:hypothetical protein
MARKPKVEVPKIEEMTREELLLLAQTQGFGVNKLHLIDVRQRVTFKQAQALYEEAMAEHRVIDSIASEENYKAWKAAHRKFDRADELYDKAGAYHDLFVQVAKELRDGS